MTGLTSVTSIRTFVNNPATRAPDEYGPKTASFSSSKEKELLTIVDDDIVTTSQPSTTTTSSAYNNSSQTSSDGRNPAAFPELLAASFSSASRYEDRKPLSAWSLRSFKTPGRTYVIEGNLVPADYHKPQVHLLLAIMLDNPSNCPSSSHVLEICNRVVLKVRRKIQILSVNHSSCQPMADVHH